MKWRVQISCKLYLIPLINIFLVKKCPNQSGMGQQPSNFKASTDYLAVAFFVSVNAQYQLLLLASWAFREERVHSDLKNMFIKYKKCHPGMSKMRSLNACIIKLTNCNHWVMCLLLIFDINNNLTNSNSWLSFYLWSLLSNLFYYFYINVKPVWKYKSHWDNVLYTIQIVKFTLSSLVLFYLFLFHRIRRSNNSI